MMRLPSLWGCLLLISAAWANRLAAQDDAPQAAEPTTAAPPATAPVPLESRPYRIRIFLAEDNPGKTRLATELPPALDRSVGALWRTTISPLTDVVRIDAEALARWTESDLAEKLTADEADTWFFVMTYEQGPQQAVALRTWQPRFDWLSPVQTASWYEPRETSARVVQMCWNLFRPQILIEHVDKNAARIRIPAGDLRPADPAFELLRAGDCLVPWLFYYDREKTLKRRQELPWTYVRIDETSGPLGQATVLSGLRSALGGKTRGRIDRVAVLAKSLYPQTRLRLSVQNQPARFLPGYQLELRPKLPERAPAHEAATPDSAAESEPTAQVSEAGEEPVKVLTDRNGEVQLAPLFAHPLSWIYVNSGELLLARVPFVIGSHPSLNLEVPDDSVRLKVEGDLRAFENELINLVAQRNTLIATMRAAAKQAKWDQVKLLRRDLDKLPAHDAFEKKLTAIRVLAVQEAQTRKDRTGEIRITRLCNKAAELINRYLDPEKLRLIKDEIDELQKAVNDAPPEKAASSDRRFPS